jgi:hypothetical protein
MEWLLIVIVTTGHTNARVERLTVDRFPTEQACREAEQQELKSWWRRTATACFPVAALHTDAR